MREMYKISFNKKLGYIKKRLLLRILYDNIDLLKSMDFFSIKTYTYPLFKLI